MSDKIQIGDATLITVDVLDGLRDLPADSVQCVVTSPPYWGLRDYGVNGMIGLEATFQEYFDRMVEVCREIRRVLRPDGTFWLNLGDAYCGGGRGGQSEDKRSENWQPEYTPTGKMDNFKPKDLLMMPARLAIALQADGWWLRSEIIWAKPNPMPESVTDRPTSSHEKIYLLTKSARYYYDADAVREPYKESSIKRLSQPNFDNQTGGPKDPKTGNRSHRKVLENIRKQFDNSQGGGGTGFKGHSGDFDSNGNLLGDPRGRNLRNVWTISTQPYPEAHFATFPEALPRKCILAGTREGDIVLDPFSGSATTGLVALKLNRKYIGIELNPEYQELAYRRIEKEARQVKLPL